MNTRIFLLSGLISISLIGCYEDINVALREAHIYKGKPDQHESDALTRAEKLHARFSAIQTDR